VELGGGGHYCSRPLCSRTPCSGVAVRGGVEEVGATTAQGQPHGGVEMPTVVLEDAAHGAWRRRTGEKRDSERRVQHRVGELVLGLGRGKAGYIPSPSGGMLKGLSLNRGPGRAARCA